MPKWVKTIISLYEALSGETQVLQSGKRKGFLKSDSSESQRALAGSSSLLQEIESPGIWGELGQEDLEKAVSNKGDTT